MFDFTKWASENNLSPAATYALMKERFTSEERRQMLSEAQIEIYEEKFNLTMNEGLAVIQCINKLKGAQSDTFNFTRWVGRQQNIGDEPSPFHQG